LLFVLTIFLPFAVALFSFCEILPQKPKKVKFAFFVLQQALSLA